MAARNESIGDTQDAVNITNIKAQADVNNTVLTALQSNAVFYQGAQMGLHNVVMGALEKRIAELSITEGSAIGKVQTGHDLGGSLAALAAVGALGQKGAQISALDPAPQK